MPRGAGQRGRRRGPYNTISLQDRERLIAAHENGRDYLEVAETLGIARATAYSIIARNEQGRPVAVPRDGRRCPTHLHLHRRDVFQPLDKADARASHPKPAGGAPSVG